MAMAFPGLYADASKASAKEQKSFLRVLAAEYVLLFLASVLAIEMIAATWYVIAYVVVLAGALGLLAFRTFSQPDRRWYQARALAESVKTTAWKYAMRSKPFEGLADDKTAREVFRQVLTDVLKANRQIGSQFDGKGSNDQITPSMEVTRSLSIPERLTFYLHDRVEDQLSWYNRKARDNARAAKIAFGILASMYVAVLACVVVRINEPTWILFHPEPLLIAAAGCIGWMQIKRYNELAASYRLTWIEIGIIKSTVGELKSDDALATFVDDAEEAFSREHTQWLARRSIR